MRWPRAAEPLRLHALPDTIAALQQHIFNDVIWPDFSRIPSQTVPLCATSPADGAVPAGGRHRYRGSAGPPYRAAVGYAARGETGWWVFSGDTGGNCPEFWQRVNRLPLAALVIETAFSNREGSPRTTGPAPGPHAWPRNWRNWRLVNVAPSTSPTPSPLRRISSCRRSASLMPIPPWFCAPHDIRWLQAGDVLQV